MVKTWISKGEGTAHWLLFAIIFLGTALRLYQLDTDSLWGDELGTLIRSLPDKNLSQLIFDPLTIPDFPHPPLYFIITRLFLKFGEGDLFVRFPALLFGVAGIATTYTLGKRLWGAEVGMSGALLLALSPFHIRYSQEARYPSLILLLSLLSLLFLLQAMHKPGWRAWAGFTATAILNIYTFLPTILILGAEVLFFLALRWANRKQIAKETRGQTALYFVVSILVIMLFTLPLLPLALNALGSEKGLLSTPRWGRFLPRSDYYLEILSLWGAGKGFPLLLFALASIAGIVASVIKKEREALLLAILWIILPVTLALGLPLQKAFRLRYLTFILPVFLLLTAYGAVATSEFLAGRRLQASLYRRVFLIGGTGLLALLSIAALPAYYREGKQAWPAAAHYLQARVQEGETVALAPDRLRFPHALHHYGYAGEVVVYTSRQTPPSATGIWVVDIPWDCSVAAQRVPWVAEYSLREEQVFQVAQEGIAPLAAVLIGPARYMPIYVCHFQKSE